ncbi:MAG: hypothetical protein GXW99_11095 [Clostridiales bacterium]|nr:hypothetical protein [Clostridiales bacterium]
MKRAAAWLLACLMVLTLPGCGTKNTVGPENGVSDMPLEAILDQLLEKSQLHPGAMFESRVTNRQETAYAIGARDFTQAYEDVLCYSPMIGTSPFALLLFRLSTGADAAAFVQYLRDTADPDHWTYMHADFVDTAVNGRVVLFVMAALKMCPQDQREALLAAFRDTDPMAYDPADYVEAGQSMVLLDGVAIKDLMGEVQTDCPFLTEPAQPLTERTTAEWGLGSMEATAVTDSCVTGDLTGESPYLCGMVRLRDDTALQRFTALLHTALTEALPGGTALIVYKSDVVGFCVSCDAMRAYDATAVMTRRYGMADYTGNFTK